MNKPQNIIVHHSITPRDYNKELTENSFNNSHKARGFPASYFNGQEWFIGYHYVIFGDGEVRQYRDEATVGAHCKENEMNYKSIGICLAGDFDKEEPSEAQFEALKALIAQMMSKYGISKDKVVPHRKYATYKSCWGKKLPDDIVNYLETRAGVHWSDKAMDWVMEHEIISYKRNPDEVVTWGAFVVVLYKLTLKIMSWVRNPPKDDNKKS